MNDRTLSRRLSTSVVDALKAHGHVLVVKGGAEALARELDELVAPEIAVIEPRMKPRGVLAGEPTSTFGDDAVDQAVEEVVGKLTRALMSSDHVEDVFAEDNVIRRDIFRAVRDGLLVAPIDPAADDYSSITVKLDLLGYVAATVSKRADPATLRQALDRAAVAAEARLAGYVPELREATFRAEDGGSDERLDLEEAVADELTDLVEQGVVELPTVERQVDLGRAVTGAERRALRGRIDAAAEATLRGAGCAASWQFADARTLRVTFTPLSDRDARGVDAPTAALAREIGALLASVDAKPASAGALAPSPSSSRRGGAPSSKRTPAPSSKRTPAPSSKRTPAPSSKRTPAPSSKRTPAPSSKRAPAPAPAPSAVPSSKVAAAPPEPAAAPKRTAKPAAKRAAPKRAAKPAKAAKAPKKKR